MHSFILSLFVTDEITKFHNRRNQNFQIGICLLKRSSFNTLCACVQVIKQKHPVRPSLTEYAALAYQDLTVVDEKQNSPDVDMADPPSDHDSDQSSDDSVMADAPHELDNVVPPPPQEPAESNAGDDPMIDVEGPPPRQVPPVEPLPAQMPPPPGSPAPHKRFVYVGTDHARPPSDDPPLSPLSSLPTESLPISSPLGISNAPGELGPHPTRPSGDPTDTPMGNLRSHLGLVRLGERRKRMWR